MHFKFIFLTLFTVLLLNGISANQSSFKENDAYFLFVVSPNNASNTNGHVINVSYNFILNQAYCKKVCFIFPEEKFPENYLAKYFNEVLKIEFTEAVKNNTIISQDLFNEYSKSNMSELLFIKNGKVEFREVVKFLHNKRLENLTVDIINTKNIKNYEMIKLDTNYLHSALDVYYSLGNRLYQLSDVNNRLSLLDELTGKIEKTLDIGSIDPIELYEKHFSKRKKDLEFAIKERNWFKEHNRKSTTINSCSYSEYDSSIYISASIQVMEYLKDEFTVPGKGGEMVTFEKGTPIGNLYHIMLRVDKDLQILNIYPIKPNKNKIEKYLDTSPVDAFYINKDTLYSYSELIDSRAYQTSKKKVKTYSYYILKNGIFTYDGTIAPSIPKDIYKYDVMYLKSKFIPTNDGLFVVQDPKAHLYKLGNSQPYFTFDVDTTIAEVLPRTIENVKEIKMAFRMRDAKYFEKEQYFFIGYESFGKEFLSVVNRNFKEIQKIQLALKKEWYPYNSVFHNQYLIMPSIEDDGIYLIKIPLSNSSTIKQAD